MRNRCLRDQKRAGEVGREDLLPEFEGALGEAHPSQRGTGVVHKYIEPANVRYKLVDKSRCLGGVGKIGLKQHCLATVLCDAPHNRLRLVAAAVAMYSHHGARLSQFLGDRAPDAHPGSGDQCRTPRK